MIPHGLIAISDVLLVVPVLLGLHYQKQLSLPLKSAWYAGLLAIIVCHGFLLSQEILHNILILREDDFLGFFINAHVAASGHNFYVPTFGQMLARPFAVSESFRQEILDVGFWYPPPSIFVFLPLAAFEDPRRALAIWYGIQICAFLGTIVVLARTFLREHGASGIAVVAALLMLLPATAITVLYAQTAFLALLFTALFWTTRRSALGGVWLVLGIFVKPFIAALTLVLFCRKYLQALGGAALAATVLSVATLAVYGINTFATYFTARPDSRIPARVYGESTVQSLLSLVIRITHGVSSGHLSHFTTLVFSIVSTLLVAATLWLCLRSKADDQVLLSLTLSLALLVYPTSLAHYTVFLILPILVLWSRRSRSLPPWAITGGVCATIVLTLTDCAVFANLLSWITFAFIAAPRALQAKFARPMTSALRSIRNLALGGQRATSTALGLTIVGLLIVSVVFIQSALRPQLSFFGASGTDFRAFYCAGEAANSKTSPYRVEPLRSCEHRVQPARGWSDELVLPAPLPGYDVAFFAVLSHLPYSVAKAIWFCVITSSILAAILFLTRLTNFPALLLLLGLSLTDGYQSIIYGQLPAVVVAALCAAAYFLKRRLYIAAAIALGASMIEPHLGLPACLAVFIWRKHSRAPLAMVALALVTASILSVGVAENIAYFSQVLPQHAAAELVASDQYALSHELHVVGLSDRSSLAVGSASYVLMVIAGIILGLRVAARYTEDAFIVLVPSSAALLGGTFIHGLQFAAALPAAFLLLSYARDGVPRRIASLILALLVVPWDFIIQSGSRFVPILALSIVTLIALVFSSLRLARMRVKAIAAASVVIAFSALVLIIHHIPGSSASAHDFRALPSSVLMPNAAASQQWAAYLREESILGTRSFRSEAAKIPYWLAIALLLTAAATQGQSRTGRDQSKKPSSDIALGSVNGY